MKGVLYSQFNETPYVASLKDPTPDIDGVVLEVKHSGLCLSDWHGWRGHDPDITLPHVPGHELSGVVIERGENVGKFKIGDRVTLPFVCGCGKCCYCREGNPQVCNHQFQPGFTDWGSFAQYVAIKYADYNLVSIPDDMDFQTAAILGCRFATSFRAVVDRGQIKPGEWIAIFGCGGVGLSAIMIAKAFNARIIAIDLEDSKLQFAAQLGAECCLDPGQNFLIEKIKDISDGGVHLTLDAVGKPEIIRSSLAGLRKGGRHLQVGLLDPNQNEVSVPFHLLIANEWHLMGSHGMQAYRYEQMIRLILEGKLQPSRLITGRITLDQAPGALVQLDKKPDPGITVIEDFIW